MIRVDNWHWPMLLFAFAACAPARPGVGTGTMTDGVPMTSTAGNDTSSGSDHADSSDGTGADTKFTCSDGTWYEGDLDISNLTDFDALRNVGGVTGSLQIGGTNAIVDLEFLSCLEIVEGMVWIHDNEDLATLHGLEQLRMVSGNVAGPYSGVVLERNPALSRIDSLDSLEAVGALVVESNESLADIEMSVLREIGTLSLGAHCTNSPEPDQPLSAVGSYPVLEHVETFILSGQHDFVSLESLVALADRGVVFEEAFFRYNYNLPQSEIDAFSIAASIVPEACSNKDDMEQCLPCPTD